MFAVFPSVVRQQRCLRVHAVTLHTPAGQFVFELEQLRAGLREVNIDGVELLDDGQKCRLVLTDQSAFRNFRRADAAGDWRDNFCVAEVQRSGFERGLGGKHLRFTLRGSGHRSVIVLFAHRVDFDQRFEPGGFRLRIFEICLRLGDSGTGAGPSRLKRGGINFKKQIAGAHFRSFLEVALQ